MELRRYLQVALRRWPIVLIAFAVTTISTLMLVLPEPVKYGSSSTFVVRPRTTDASDGVRAVDTLIRGPQIAATYARIARSGRVRELAKQNLDPAIPTSGLRVSADVVAGTNLLEIKVTGPDPNAVDALAEAVSKETVKYVDDLGDAYRLEQLDASTAATPVKTNKSITIVLGVLFGLGLGILLAVFVEYLRGDSGDGGGARVDAEPISGWRPAADPYPTSARAAAPPGPGPPPSLAAPEPPTVSLVAVPAPVHVATADEHPVVAVAPVVAEPVVEVRNPDDGEATDPVPAAEPVVASAELDPEVEPAAGAGSESEPEPVPVGTVTELAAHSTKQAKSAQTVKNGDGVQRIRWTRVEP